MDSKEVFEKEVFSQATDTSYHVRARRSRNSASSAGTSTAWV